MQLLIDCGNTRSKLCVLNDGEQTDIVAIENIDLMVKLSTLIADVRSITISSVANQRLLEQVRQLAKRHQCSYQHITTEIKAFGVTNGYNEPMQLGSDRWLSLIGAHSIYQSNIVLVSLGTATTIDYLTAQGQHIGGWIVPGLELMKSALYEGTANIKPKTINIDCLSIGKNTAENVQHGGLLATIGTIEQACCYFNQQNLTIDQVILSGGNAELINKHCQRDTLVNQRLIFTGLARYLLNK